jgi:hypothetical protein
MANRDLVQVRLLPEDLAALTGLTWGMELPLFLVIFGGIVVGVLIGFVWEWFREHGHPWQGQPEVARGGAAGTRAGQFEGPEGHRAGGRGAGAAGKGAVMQRGQGQDLRPSHRGDVAAVAAAGAAYAGFVFFPKARAMCRLPRRAPLAITAPEGLCKVALVVDADDAALDAIVDGVPLDMLQLHGHETPERVAEVRRRAMACR